MNVEILQEKDSLVVIIVLSYYLLVYSVRFFWNLTFMKAVLWNEILNALLDTGIEISLRFSPFYFSLIN